MEDPEMIQINIRWADDGKSLTFGPETMKRLLTDEGSLGEFFRDIVKRRMLPEGPSRR